MAKHPIKIRKNKTRKWIFYGCLIALPLLQFIVMYIIVNFNSLTMAFRSYDLETGWSWVGFENFTYVFRQLATNPEMKYAFLNSIIFWIVSTIITIPLGLLFAFYIAKKYPFSKFFRVILFVPSIVSASILTIMFKYYANDFLPYIINSIFGAKVPKLLSEPDTIFVTLMFFNIFISFGVSVLMYTGTMKNISSEIFEAAEIDGASPFRQFISIVIPQMVGTISVFVISGAAAMFVTQLNLFSIYHVTADPKALTVGYVIYRDVYLAGGVYSSYPRLAALGVFITAIVAPIIVISRYLVKKYDPMG